MDIRTQFVKALRIRCAKCGTLVERVDLREDIENDVYRIGVLCHGETQQMVLPTVAFERNADLVSDLVAQEGLAFGGSVLPEALRRLS